MSACSVQAISHVGCRLMVASSANTSRPRLPAACGDIAFALATKAAMSSEADGLSCGNEPALRPSGTAGFGLIGSPDMNARAQIANPMWAVTLSCSTPLHPTRLNRPFEGAGKLSSVLGNRGEGCNRPRIGHRRRLLHGAERAIVVEEFVEHPLDRRLGFIRAGIAHVVVLKSGANNGNPGLLTDFFVRNDTGIGLEDGVLRAERNDLESAVSHER